MCRFWYQACTNATFAANGEGNATQQFACDQALKQNCGNLTTSDDAATSTMSSSRPTSTSGSGSGSQGSSETSSSASTPSPTTGAAVRLAREFGAPVLAGGMIALFGIAL